VRFGVFDHLDRAGGAHTDIGRQYADRLVLVEHYDRAGLHAYHLAEHHGTPLGMAPSPGIFLAAVAQRSTRLRFGPLVSLLSLQHPLRVLEEVCMLDQLSGGRLEFGIGRGASPFELGFFDVTPEDAAAVYGEVVEILLGGATSGHVSAEGPRFVLRDVPMHLAPVQRTYPPLWYGVGRPESARWAAERGVNIVGLASAIRPLTDTYRAAWRRRGGAGALPLLGMSRHVAGTRRRHPAARSAVIRRRGRGGTVPGRFRGHGPDCSTRADGRGRCELPALPSGLRRSAEGGVRALGCVAGR
jgi:alkanesulfonate monooxygenase SsuD/methylene tetrahydromethanopterin reductase-like flavin-dependent oxidoreductase (luciferase family)